MTPEQQARIEYLDSIEDKMKNAYEANFYEINGLLKAYIKAEKEMIKFQEEYRAVRENPMSDLN